MTKTAYLLWVCRTVPWISLYITVLPVSADAVFSGKQAARGMEIYQRACASCHGMDLGGGGGAAALRGEAFLERWSANDQSIADLFYVNRTSMPLGSAGVMSKQEYFDVTLYLLAENGHPVGNTPMHLDDPRIESIRVGEYNPRPVVKNRTCPAVDFHEPAADASAPGPTQQELLTADSNQDDWLLPGHGYGGQRFSGLSRITRENVHSLQKVCVFESGDPDPMQSYLNVYRGVLFFTSNHSTFAVDAGNCKLLWRYDRKPRCDELWGRARGLGLKDGKVIRGTPDGYLIALNIRTGDLIWERRISDTTRGGGGLSMPPLVFEDMVYIGPAPAEVGLKGWVKAFDINDGSPVWTFNIIPDAGEPGAGTWGSAEALERGGGGVWTPFTLDTATATLFLAAGNPGPAYYDDARPGKNLYTNSAIALDARSGRMKWYRQFLPGDYHDWDVNHASPVITVNENGTLRKLLIVTGKDGYLHAVDRETTKVLYTTELSRQVNTSAPLQNDADTHFCPGINGGTQWNGPAYSPVNGNIYVTTMEWCASLRKTEEVRYISGGFYLGGLFKIDPYDTAFAHLTSLDAASGRINWRYRSPDPMTAAVTVTASSLVLTGEIEGNFIILDAETGSRLYQHDIGSPLGAGIITYSVNDRQFIAVASGAASPIWYQEPATAKITLFALPR